MKTPLWKLLPVIVLFLGMGFPGALWAVQLTPSRQEISLAPGESAVGQVEAYNNTSSTLTVTVGPRDWFILPENKNISINDWLHLKRTEFTLKPGQKEIIPFAVSVPTRTAQMDHPPSGVMVGMLAFSSQSTDAEMVRLVISVSVYVMVRGTERYEGDLRAFLLQKAGDSLQAVVNIENKGNIHLRPVGRVEIFDKKNRLLETVRLQEGRPVFPGQARSYMGNVPWKKWKNGRYRAHVKMVLAPDHVVEEDVLFQLRKGSEIKLLPSQGNPSSSKASISDGAKDESPLQDPN